jgi:uncharacterized membrane protein YhaH (DUF805 family)
MFQLLWSFKARRILVRSRYRIFDDFDQYGRLANAAKTFEFSTISGLWVILWLASICAVAAKRLHDLNRSGLLVIAIVVAFAALSIGGQTSSAVGSLLLLIGIIWLGSKRGERGVNRFGAEPT